MTEQRKNRGPAARWVWPVVIALTTVVIWGFSLMPGAQSQAQSEFVRRIVEALLGDGPLAEFLMAHFPIRKVAHFTEYFVLGVEWACYRRVRRWPVCWGYGLPVAVADELLQFTAAGRAPMVTDVLLDTAGYLCGYWLTVGIQHCFRHKRKKN